MLRKQLISFLKIRPDESQMAVLVAGLFLCIQAGQGIGESAAFALFLTSINVEFLPYMYMGLGVIVFLVSVVFSASLSRFQNASVVRNVIAWFTVIFFGEWLGVVFLQNPLLFPLLWLTTFGMGVVFSTSLWVTAGEVCDARQAKRLFPLFTSMGILGTVLGNLLTSLIASMAGAETLILVYALLLGGGYLIIRRITTQFFKPEKDATAPFSLLKDLRDGFEFMRGEELFRLIAITSILFSILFFTVDFPFSERISITYANDAAGLAGFKGIFTSITTAVTFLISLLLANRLYTRIGIVNSVLIMPITYIIAFLLFFVSYTFWGAVAAKFGQLIVLGGISGTAWSTMFNVVPVERRGQVLSFNNGVPAQIGVILSGVLILLSSNFLNAQDVLILGGVIALITTYMTLRMRKAYGDALLAALRAGRTDVFSEDQEEDSFTGYKNDPAALQAILKSLADEHPETRRLAAEMLGRMQNRLAIPDLLEHLSDVDATVRAASIRALADLGASAASRIIIRKLNDPDNFVRETTLMALPKLGVTATPELIQKLEVMSKSRKNFKVKAHAAVVLVYFGRKQFVHGMLYRLIRNKNHVKREIGLDALQHIAEYTGDVPFREKTILSLLKDPNPIIRRETLKLLMMVNSIADLEPILQALSDDNARVRKHASNVLRKAWPASKDGIFHILEQMNTRSLDAALDSIPAGVPEVSEMIRNYIQRESSNVWYVRTLINSLNEGGKVIELLLGTLNHRVSKSEERLVKAVGLFGNKHAFDIVRKNINQGDANTRAAALEALETLGDPVITKEVLPILERGGMFSSETDQKLDETVVIGGLLESNDYWLRAISARAIPELCLYEYRAGLKKLKSDPVPLVSQAARSALARLDGDANMKTLRTLSTLERVLLMRAIPMFSNLSPEDLEKIAEVAEEQFFTKSTAICREGDQGDSLYIIVSGEVEVKKDTETGPVVLAIRKEGEFVGEMAILESTTRSATLTAWTDVRLLVLDADEFESILRDRPEVAISVLQHMSRRVRELNRLVQGV